MDAVFITHSHPDHFDLSTLIRLDPNTVIYVPEVERESLLAVDMASRLEQLGFSNVHRLRPGAEITFGGTKVRAFPFFGEQPTTGDILHPDVRNVGCTYLCESGGRRVLILADSGRDRDGDVRDVSAAIRRHFGDVDVVFGGYRAFAMYPILYLFSSVARFLLFVPPADLIFRQKIMNDSDDLLDTAERCGAKYVVPYATGGAPWYWERGLGWRPENVTGPRTDRTPEDVVRCASARATSADGLVPSPARVLVLHAGETLRFGEKDIQVEHGPTQIWPYDPPAWYQANIALRRDGGSMLASARSVFRAIGPNLNKWRKERELVCFFFMRKPPGLRLRFLAGSSIKNDVSALLDNLVHQSVIERWVTTVYEPETDRFGGTAAMQAIHEWFDADTRQWMILDRLRSEGRASIGRDDLCAAIALDFVKATVPDRAETWAIWRLYASSNGLEPSGMTETPFGDFTVIKSAASPEEQEVVQAYEEANRALSAQLICLWERGELSAGIRGVLAAIILFHFNRHGLDILSNSRIAWTMIRALDPSTEQVQRQRKS
ncbi:MAG: hypothetical protein AUI36_43360 [Cyanobacteria bacterium 13_1_40CM_2_61_4]|nr:MAG: hypothetical protein AUI36_43360 [Cyanobacteria bacterium 13_1_40CM_2_61_4]